jgi:hypothetical protein
LLNLGRPAAFFSQRRTPSMDLLRKLTILSDVDELPAVLAVVLVVGTSAALTVANWIA